MRSRTRRMKLLRNWQNTQTSFSSLRKTWTTYTRALELRRRTWCKFNGDIFCYPVLALRFFLRR